MTAAMTMLYIAVTTLGTWTVTNAATGVMHGSYHTCAFNDGEGVECWGINSNGQLGLGDTSERQMPTDAVDLGSDFAPRDAGCGEYHCCAVSTNNAMKCWGANFAGMLGYEDTNNRGDG